MARQLRFVQREESGVNVTLMASMCPFWALLTECKEGGHRCGKVSCFSACSVSLCISLDPREQGFHFIYKEEKELFGVLVLQCKLPHEQITLAELNCESK